MPKETRLEPSAGEIVIINPKGTNTVSAKTTKTKRQTTVTTSGTYVEPTPTPEPTPEPTPTPTPVTQRPIQGYGQHVTGGDNTQEFWVRTPIESGPESLAYLCQGSNRKIMLGFEGTLNLPVRLTMRGSNVTIDGSKAPGKGVTMMGDTIQPSYGARNIKLVDFRHRGYGTTSSQEGDNISPTRDVQGVLIARLSLSGSNDEGIGAWDNVRDATIQDCILSKGQTAIHNFGILVGDHCRRFSIHHNILIDIKYRNPAIGWDGDVISDRADTLVGDVVGNLIWDYGDYAVSVYNSGWANVVKNYTKRASASSGLIDFHTATSKGFFSGNVDHDGRSFPASNTARFVVPDPFKVTEESNGLEAARSNLVNAGCRVGGLDDHDKALLARITL